MFKNGKADSQRAVEYILAHPTESKREQARGADVSESTIANARRQLILEGKLALSRKGEVKAVGVPAPAPPPPGEPPQPRKPAAMLDHDAMKALAEFNKLMESDALDDSEVHKRLLKQCLRFAFDPRLHPDTRMSASQMWSKLRDQAKSKDLGPNAPLTFDDAVARMADMMKACGPKITLAAVNIAFDAKEPPHEGQVPNDPGEPAPVADGPASAS